MVETSQDLMLLLALCIAWITARTIRLRLIFLATYLKLALMSICLTLKAWQHIAVKTFISEELQLTLTGRNHCRNTFDYALCVRLKQLKRKVTLCYTSAPSDTNGAHLYWIYLVTKAFISLTLCFIERY